MLKPRSPVALRVAWVLTRQVGTLDQADAAGALAFSGSKVETSDKNSGSGGAVERRKVG